MRHSILLSLLCACLSFGAISAKLPLSFEPNAGQADPEVKFISRTPGTDFSFTSTGLAVLGPGAGFRIQFVGARRSPRIGGRELLPGRSNYLIGKDPKRWRTGIPQYAKLRYDAIYPGVDLVFYGNTAQIEYDFVLAPGADPHKILVEFAGIEGLRLGENGDLVVRTRGGEVRQHKPRIFQERNGIRKAVDGGYVLRDKHRAGFEVASYDATLPLVIDPVLVYSTYLGEVDPLHASLAMALDNAGSVILAGSTRSGSFPATSGSFQPVFRSSECKSGMVPRPGLIPCSDAFVTKLNPEGTALIYSTYLGGIADDAVTGIAVDAAGNAYVTGTTGSIDFPVTAGALAGATYRFTAKLNPSGSALIYSTTGAGGGRIAVDRTGNAYLAGDTVGVAGISSVQKLDAAGASLLYSFDFLGATSALAVDSAGNAYVAGNTSSPYFLTTPGAFQTTLAGGPKINGDAFVMKLNSSGTAPVYSTLLGGTEDDYAYAIAVDAAGDAYVAGHTRSGDFPSTRGAYQPCYRRGVNNPADAFALKLNPNGTALVYSTFLGGMAEDVATAIAVDPGGSAYVAGLTQSSDFPVTQDAFQSALEYGPGLPGIPSQGTFVSKLGVADSGPLASVCVVSAGSYFHGPVSPGEIITIFDAHTGPKTGLSGGLTAEGRFGTELGGMRVLFDGIPAPLLYVQENQVNAIVPYGIAGERQTTARIEYGGQPTNDVVLAVAPSYPAVFTLDMTGVGPGAIVNAEEGTINSLEKPAQSGSWVSIYATGEGQTDPPGIDGKLAVEPLPKPLLPVKVYLDGVETEVQYAGGAPTLTAGVIQINARVPIVTDGPRSMTVLVKIGDATSQPGVTVAVAP